MTIKFDFTDKVALVTGGSRGIGREISMQFAEAGATVVVHYARNHEAADATLAMLEGDGHIKIQGDLKESADLQRVTATVIETLGHIDILVNNAGVFTAIPIADVSFEEWQHGWKTDMQTNVIGAGELTFLVAQHMIAQGSGRVVNVSSRGAFRGEPDAPAYGASKAAMNAMGQSLAKALAPHNVFVHTVAPGFVETEMAARVLSGESGVQIRAQSPLNRVAQPAEVARTVLFCATEETAFLTGCIIDVNGASYLRS